MADISNITVSVEGVDTVCKIKDKVARNDIAINRTTLGTQCKNLLKNTAVTQTINGVTVTVNTDKTVSVQGTTTSQPNFVFLTKAITLKAHQKYYLTGAYSNSVQLSLRDSTAARVFAEDSGNGAEYTPDNDTEAVVLIRIGIIALDTPVTLYPMLRYADITDDTYEPYKESVDERITNNVSDIAINKSTLGYQRKNLLKPTSSKTRAGITYTVNQDGSVALTGTSTTGSSYNYFSIPITLQPGKYKVNGMPETSKTNTYRVDLRAKESGGTAYGYGAKEFEVEFTETTTAYYMIRIDGSYKNPLDGVIFYPMIRYADILDDTYEPYQPSVQEQTAYSLSVSGKSTSAAISYNGVPTLICLTPNTADSTAGGLYMINSAGAVVKLIEKTGVVVAAASSSKTFTITNNTSTAMDVCISRCWER